MVLIRESWDVNHLRIWSEKNPLLSCFSSDLGSLNIINSAIVYQMFLINVNTFSTGPLPDNLHDIFENVPFVYL